MSETSNEDDAVNSVSLKKKRLVKIMQKLRKVRQKRQSVGPMKLINYRGPYIDSTGEKFFLPKEWVQKSDGHLNGAAKKLPRRQWKELSINYSFDDEMSGTQLIKI